MKKILFSLIALVCSMSMNAQVMKVMKNGEEVAKYKGAEYTVVFEEAPVLGKSGTAKATIGGSEVDVEWVQLWENGPRFAKYNVGVTDSKAESYGGYYCWGSSINKDSNKAYKDGTDALTGDDDTATKLWGSNWRMPTQDELQNLKTYCDQEWTSNYNDTNVKGRIFKGKGDYASNSVFLPAAGQFYGVGTDVGVRGCYWSSTPYGSGDAQYLYFLSGRADVSNKVRYYGCSVRAVLAEEEPAGPDYVEIGGKKWATMNLGATTVAGSLATCAGDYYQWGSVNTLYSSVSWSGTTPTFTWKSGKESGFVNANKEYTANADLAAANDIVAQTLGGGWRMPTKADFEALHNACTGSTSNSSPTELYSSTPGAGVYWLAENQTFLSEYSGVAGILYVSTADTSKRVFFPAAGSVLNASFRNGGTYGYYWSSSLYTDNMALAFGLYFKSSYVDLSQFYTRYSGFTVRPVKD